MIEIVAVGAAATIQDLGRPGYAALGVARSGAFDRGALRLANRLVGNAEDTAGIEITLGNLSVTVQAAATLALAGAVCPGAPDWAAAMTVAAGTRLRLGTPLRGLRSYLAVRGGIDAQPVLGSRSTDTMSGLGPAPLQPGDRLAIGAARGAVSGALAVGRDPEPTLGVHFGPRDDWFADPSALLATDWTVRPDSDRVGVRLDGPRLERARHGELPSEPMRPGAIQVPPDGRPILFGPDAPVTGGYPVIGFVADLDPAAQLRPGDTVRFRSARGAGSPT